VARDLAPRAIAFVGKAAYEGAFGERPALGLQERRLWKTWLFVLPSTSPANAAVPYEERLRWFRELKNRLDGSG
jgi:G:T/U-mismatch repair DNA glycosylase